MSTLEEIEKAILQLPKADFSLLREWIAQRDAELWDRQFEQDVLSGRLDALGAEALAELDAGRCTEL